MSGKYWFLNISLVLLLAHYGYCQTNVTCGTNSFRCANQTFFYQCLLVGSQLVVADLNAALPCPANTACSNNDTTECASPLVTTTVAVTTLSSNITTIALSNATTTAPSNVTTTVPSNVTTTALSNVTTTAPSNATSTAANVTNTTALSNVTTVAASNSTTPVATTTVATTITTQCPSQLTCTSPGKFPDPTLANCKGYVLCVRVGGVLVPFQFTCPLTSRYSPTSQSCSLTYTCPASSAIPCQATLTPIPTTTTLPTLGPNTCTLVGKLPDPSVPNCKGYILCSRNSFGVLVATRFTCPSTSRFDPLLKGCSLLYPCPATSAAFTCTRAGKFPDLSVTGCKRYNLCILNLLSGGFTLLNVPCPVPAIFNPNLSICTLPNLYNCLT